MAGPRSRPLLFLIVSASGSRWCWGKSFLYLVEMACIFSVVRVRSGLGWEGKGLEFLPYDGMMPQILYTFLAEEDDDQDDAEDDAEGSVWQ
ncbi:hypothetical protein FB451DRAFT_1406357 [Mycena latifolia]|nr:hypothetical protein FB451DRAFT_1406357 [Mycena latifolia]